ncbi:MAG: paraquat-inducible protein A [Mesorhizobium sp.]|nr:paraquat-inducible protein A [Mesorhizobium sp.]MBL8577011.1 paraquat-inducible protein A [Mesorhizobium sp.]
MRLALPVMLFASGLSLGLGLVLPLIRIDRLYFLSDEPSLLKIVAGLWMEGETILAAIIALFSIVLPCLKLGLLHVAAYADAKEAVSVPGWMRALSNWSMLDVMLVALVIFAAKTSGLASAITQPGLWFFAASAVLTATASALLKSQPAAARSMPGKDSGDL